MESRGFFLKTLTLGGGVVAIDADQNARLHIPAKPSGYANAQLDDHRMLPRRAFPWRPPVTMKVRARATTPSPLGTFGFGFWNDPFSLTLGQAGAARKLPVPPSAVWFFFGSPPNDMRLFPANPGWGWKAQTIKSPAIPGWVLAAPALVAYVASKIPILRRPVMGTALRRISCDERVLDMSFDAWHTYEIRWDPDAVTFLVDESSVLRGSVSPEGPLGFVTWIDNQYAIASADAGLRFGVVRTEMEQSLELQDLEIQRTAR